jgi:hypothetical protein
VSSWVHGCEWVKERGALSLYLRFHNDAAPSANSYRKGTRPTASLNISLAYGLGEDRIGYNSFRVGYRNPQYKSSQYPSQYSKLTGLGE